MRLRPEKIEHLANLVFESLAQNPELTLHESRDHIVGLVRRVITDDLRMEDEIEEEARRVLESHRGEIDRTGASFEKLVLKAKQKLAQERKMVL